MVIPLPAIPTPASIGEHVLEWRSWFWFAALMQTVCAILRMTLPSYNGQIQILPGFMQMIVGLIGF